MPDFTRLRNSNYLYLTGLILLVAGMPVSLFLTSLSQFFLAGSFFLEGDLRGKVKRFFSNKPMMLIAGIWLLHIIGMVWTADFQEGIKDIRIKLPLLVLSVIIGGSSLLTVKEFKLIAAVFIFSVFAGTISAMAVLTGIIHREIYDIRDIFIYHISHIRFALFTSIAVYLLAWFAFFQKPLSLLLKILAIALAVWFVIFLAITQSVTGLVVLIAATIVTLFFLLLKVKNRVAKVVILIALFAFPAIVGYSIFEEVRLFYTIKNIPINKNDKTSAGNEYQFYDNISYENGYPVNVYIQDDELRTTWNKRSLLPYDSLDRRGQYMKSTILRYLTSKGLRKDGEAVAGLSQEEVVAIENGVSNFRFRELSGLRPRIYQIIWETDNMLKGQNPNGHSVTQRAEFWKAAFGIFKEHPFFGVGTGDLVQSYKEEYVKQNSRLDDNHRLRAHNQYLSIAAGFGLFGFVYFLFALLYPLSDYKKLSPLFLLFLLTLLISMLSEDTLETQPGATFAAFFFAIFLNTEFKIQNSEF